MAIASSAIMLVKYTAGRLQVPPGRRTKQWYLIRRPPPRPPSEALRRVLVIIIRTADVMYFIYLSLSHARATAMGGKRIISTQSRLT